MNRVKMIFAVMIVTLFCCCVCRAEENGEIKNYGVYIDITDMVTEPAYTTIIGIYATNRQALYTAMEQEGWWFPMVVEINGHVEEWDDAPYGDIYLGDGTWAIRYEQNGGYMPIWRAK